MEYIEAFNANSPNGAINPDSKYFQYRNKMFENITGNNCANAVSQALWFGGIPMSFGPQKGDVVAFYEEKDPDLHTAIPYHVGMISAVDATKGTISYSANTSDVVGRDLADAFEESPTGNGKKAGTVIIIKMKDEMTVPYNPKYPSPPEQLEGFRDKDFGRNKISAN